MAFSAFFTFLATLARRAGSASRSRVAANALSAFFTFLAALAGFAAVAFGAFFTFLAALARRAGSARSALRSCFAAVAFGAFLTVQPPFAGFAAVAFGALLTFLASGAGFTRSPPRSGFASGSSFTPGSSCADEALESLRTLRTDGACHSGYARDALETLRTSGSVGPGAVVACGSLRSRQAGRTRFASQRLEHLRIDLMSARDDVAVVARRDCRTGKHKDGEGTGSDEGGYALHSLALSMALWE